jgi:MFS family permease
MIGMVIVWGNIIVYVTSYFRSFDESISLQDTFVVFPLTMMTGSLFMQVGSVMMDYFHPKVHLMIGGLFFVGSIFIASFINEYLVFVLFYAIISGIGYGIVYMLPVKNAYSFFPNNKGLVGGLIMSFYSLGAVLWSFVSKGIINPEN